MKGADKLSSIKYINAVMVLMFLFGWSLGLYVGYKLGSVTDIKTCGKKDTASMVSAPVIEQNKYKIDYSNI